ncbi:signal peptidase complex catalytic subunit SEC11C-like protein [Ramicandelaber brevisporus]|nr:signal peptidase complex catalytic subunit SEC11C-like protein [Ramicandelaber brevisporus]
MDAIKQLRNTGVRQLLLQSLNFIMVLSTAFMLWKGMALYSNCESPIVVVLSGSMEPAFQRGDILFLSNRTTPVEIGEITVFKNKGSVIPIVHRALRIHTDAKTGEQLIRTKGDNNNVDDRVMYPRGEQWIKQSDVVGRVQGYVPYLGMATILMNDYPKLKYVLIGGLGVMALLQRE